MRRFRFSIATLMLAIAYAGIGCAGLVSGSDIWFESIYTLTAFILLATAVSARDNRFWRAFSIVGWGYFVLGLGPWFGFVSRGAAHHRSFNHYLLTARAVWWLSDAVVPASVPGLYTYADDQNRLLRVSNAAGVAHCMFTLGLALFASFLAVGCKKAKARRARWGHKHVGVKHVGVRS